MEKTNINNSVKITITFLAILLIGLISSPYIISNYLAKQYKNLLSVWDQELHNHGYHVSGEFKAGYFKSTATSKIENATGDGIQLQHRINNGPLFIDGNKTNSFWTKLILATIETSIETIGDNLIAKQVYANQAPILIKTKLTYTGENFSMISGKPFNAVISSGQEITWGGLNGYIKCLKLNGLATVTGKINLPQLKIVEQNNAIEIHQIAIKFNKPGSLINSDWLINIGDFLVREQQNKLIAGNNFSHYSLLTSSDISGLHKINTNWQIEQLIMEDQLISDDLEITSTIDDLDLKALKNKPLPIPNNIALNIPKKLLHNWLKQKIKTELINTAAKYSIMHDGIEMPKPGTLDLREREQLVNKLLQKNMQALITNHIFEENGDSFNTKLEVVDGQLLINQQITQQQLSADMSMG